MSKLTHIMHVIKDDEPPTAIIRQLPRRTLTQQDVAGFMKAAESRTDSSGDIWEDMEILFKRLSKTSPLRARQLRGEIKYIRKQAHKHGFSWGLR